MPIKMQRLQFCGCKLTNGHTVGFYSIKQENTLDMVLCLRGGGKRARVTTATTAEAKVSKEENMEFKKREIFVIMLQLEKEEPPIYTS